MRYNVLHVREAGSSWAAPLATKSQCIDLPMLQGFPFCGGLSTSRIVGIEDQLLSDHIVGIAGASRLNDRQRILEVCVMLHDIRVAIRVRLAAATLMLILHCARSLSGSFWSRYLTTCSYWIDFLRSPLCYSRSACLI